ncbi:MAG: helix-turn-helix domain-containing protein [Thermodesulfobacteriota bacterium]
MSNEYLTREELARRWRIGLKTVDRLRATGRLPWINLSPEKDGPRDLVRFRIEDVRAFEEARQTYGSTPEAA